LAFHYLQILINYLCFKIYHIIAKCNREKIELEKKQKNRGQTTVFLKPQQKNRGQATFFFANSGDTIPISCGEPGYVPKICWQESYLTN